jgi:hypothetical protein
MPAKLSTRLPKYQQTYILCENKIHFLSLKKLLLLE